MTTNTEGLKPYPFCGEEAQTDFIEGESYIVECSCIACNAQTGHHDDDKSAIAAWNRRPTAQASEAILNEIELPFPNYVMPFADGSINFYNEETLKHYAQQRVDAAIRALSPTQPMKNGL
jgi:Lar family restriction alleviation protein